MKKNKIIVLLLVLVVVFSVFFYKKILVKKYEKNKMAVENRIDDKSKKDKDKSNENKDVNKSKDSKNTSIYTEKDVQFKDFLVDKKPIILDFSQSTWHACKVLHIALEKLNEKYKDKITIKSVDLNKSESFAQQYPIRVTPTIFFFNSDGSAFIPSKELTKKLSYVSYKNKNEDGIVLSGTEGLLQQEVLEQLIEEMIENAK